MMDRPSAAGWQRQDGVAAARRAIGRGDRPMYRLERMTEHEFRVVELPHTIVAYDAAAALRATREWISFLLDLPDGSFDVRLQTAHRGRRLRERRPEGVA